MGLHMTGTGGYGFRDDGTQMTHAAHWRLFGDSGLYKFTFHIYITLLGRQTITIEQHFY